MSDPYAADRAYGQRAFHQIGYGVPGLPLIEKRFSAVVGLFVKELNIVLDALKESGNDAAVLFNKVTSGFKKYDESRSNGDKLKVSK